MIFFTVILFVWSSYFTSLHDVQDSKHDDIGTYGTYPPKRDSAISFYSPESSDSLYLFSGRNIENGESLYWTDFWEYSVLLTQWRWIHGNNYPEYHPTEIVREEMFFLEANYPQGRIGGGSSLSSRDTFLLFGGGVLHKNPHFSIFYNDLWEFDRHRPRWGQWRRLAPSTPHVIYGDVGKYSEDNTPGKGSHFNLFAVEKMKQVLVTSLVNETAYKNEIWEYNELDNQWRVINNIQEVNSNGIYNPVMGTECSENHYPPSRGYSATWLMNGNVFLYGGLRYNGETNDEKRYPVYYWFHDLWNFQIETNIWCWVHGNKEINVPGPEITLEDNVPIKGYTEGYIPAYLAPSTANWVDARKQLLITFAGSSSRFPNYEHPYGSNQVWVYSVKNSAWKFSEGFAGFYEIPPHDIPRKRLRPTIWACNSSNVYIFGGLEITAVFDVENANDMWVYSKEEFICFGYDLDHPDVCSTHGSCVGNDLCECDEKFGGAECSMTVVNFWGWRIALIVIIPIVTLCVFVLIVGVIVWVCMLFHRERKQPIIMRKSDQNEEPEVIGDFPAPGESWDGIEVPAEAEQKVLVEEGKKPEEYEPRSLEDEPVLQMDFNRSGLQSGYEPKSLEDEEVIDLSKSVLQTIEKEVDVSLLRESQMEKNEGDGVGEPVIEIEMPVEKAVEVETPKKKKKKKKKSTKKKKKSGKRKEKVVVPKVEVESEPVVEIVENEIRFEKIESEKVTEVEGVVGKPGKKKVKKIKKIKKIKKKKLKKVKKKKGKKSTKPTVTEEIEQSEQVLVEEKEEVVPEVAALQPPSFE